VPVGTARISIDQKVCKKCGICVAFCPKSVLTLVDDKPFVANPEACIKCKMCELRCPEFAIVVEGEGGNE